MKPIKLTKEMFDAMCASTTGMFSRERQEGAERFMDVCKADPAIQQLQQALFDSYLLNLPCAETKH